MKLKFNPFSGELQYVTDISFLKLKGTVNTTGDLPLTENEENDCYIVKTDDRIYTWNKSTPNGILSDWLDIGSVTSIDWSIITNKPSSTPAEIDSAVTANHTQNTDIKLDEGGANEVVVADIKDAVTKKHANTLDHTQNTDTALRTDKLIVDVNGNVGIGTNDPDGFEVDKAVSETIQSRKNIRMGIAGNTPRIILEDTSGGQWEIDNNGGTLRFFKPGFGCMEIDAGGHVKINNQGNFVTGSGGNLYIDAGGWLYKSTSSKKYKKDIDYNGVDASKVYDLKPVSFKSKTDNKEFIGFIAEDVVKVEPRLVVMDVNGKPDALNYGQFSALLTKAIQELKVENDLLKKRIELLEQK